MEIFIYLGVFMISLGSLMICIFITSAVINGQLLSMILLENF